MEIEKKGSRTFSTPLEMTACVVISSGAESCGEL